MPLSRTRSLGPVAIFSLVAFCIASSGSASAVDARLFPMPIVRLPYQSNVAKHLIADLDGDGDLDIFACNINTFSVLLRAPSGAFVASTHPIAGQFRSGNLVAGDVDADGDLDVIGPATDKIVVAINDGAGGFSPTEYPAVTGHGGLGMDDFDGDGDLDVFLLDGSMGSLRICVNGGLHSGTFTLAPVSIELNGTDLRLVDIDGDQDLDALAFVVVGDEALVIAERTGIGSFAPPILVNLPGGADGVNTPNTNSIGDIDGDGDVDVVVTVRTTGWTMVNDGAGVFAPSMQFNATLDWRNPDLTELVDIDGDGDLDLLSALRTGRVEILSNDGTGVFGTPLAIPGVRDLRELATGDLNGDGWVDIAARVSGGSQTSPMLIIEGAGHGAFAERIVPDLGGSGSAGIGDLDCDGDLDVVAFERASESPYLGIRRLYNDGSAALSLGFWSSVSHEPAVIHVADLFGDCAAEVSPIFAHSTIANVDADPDFEYIDLFEDYDQAYVRVQFASMYPTIIRPRRVTAADLNADGAADIIVSSRGQRDSDPAEIAVMLNDGQGGFGIPLVTPTDATSAGIATADVNHDGAIDVIVATDRSENPSSEEDDVLVFANDGSGGLTLAGTFPAGGDASHIVLSDMDNDGRSDAVVLNPYLNWVSILKGLEGGVFGTPVSFGGAGGDARSLSIGDMDGDGDRDIVIGLADGGPVILLNRLIVPSPTCAGDINNDGPTNAADFIILAGNFGSNVPPSTNGDLNGDGIVNAADFVILAGDFGCGG